MTTNLLTLDDRHNQLTDKSMTGLYNLLNWQVEKLPLITIEGDATDTFATIRRMDDGRKVLLADKLGPNYTVIQNFDLLTNVVSPLVEQGANVRNATVFDNGKRLKITLDLTGDIVIKSKRNANVGDVISKHIVISNAHSSEQMWRLGTWITRLRCKNGATTTERNMLAGRHCKNALESMIDARKAFDVVTGEFRAYGELLERLIDAPISSHQIDRLVQRVHMPDYETLEKRALQSQATLKEKQRFEEAQTKLLKLRTEIARIHETEQTITEIRGTLYGAYHALNWYENHGGAASVDRLQSLMFGSGGQRDQQALKEVRALLTVA